MLGEFDNIYCPVCGDDYTHHSDVRTYKRLGGEDGYSYYIEPLSDKMILSSNNPSKRRGAIQIEMECENGHKFYLNIVQHKGMTYIDYEGM